MIAHAALVLLLSASVLQASEDAPMAKKLDPELLALTEAGPAALATQGPIQVMVGLSHPPTAADETALKAAGLAIRSRVGDVLTGTIAPGALESLARVEAVIRVEASRPMAPEGPPTE
jgi:hypothetical protein